MHCDWLQKVTGHEDWFGGEFEATTEFCPLIGSDLQVFDANGDGYDDLNLPLI